MVMASPIVPSATPRRLPLGPPTLPHKSTRTLPTSIITPTFSVPIPIAITHFDHRTLLKIFGASVMARVMKLAGLALCVLVLCTAMAAPAAANRKMSRGVVSLAIRALCIPTTESLLIEHEGRHECAYNLTNGDRAVGVGYNLDDDKETRRSEMTAVLADYDKVYEGKTCLNTVQISALLAMDTRRTLDRAANSVKSLDEQCCDVMAVFGDIQHSGGRNTLEGNGFEDFIEAVSAKKWNKAAELLEKTRWCTDNKDRCRDDKAIISKGCGDSAAAAVIAQVINRV